MKYYMELHHEIDSVILDVYSLMPSSGTWPFTMMRHSMSQIFVLRRTDFAPADLMDYAQKTKEYVHIPSDNRNAYLDNYGHHLKNNSEFEDWCERTADLAIGMLMQLARKKGLGLREIDANLIQPDTRSDLASRKLQAYRLFEARSNFRHENAEDIHTGTIQ